MLIHLVAAEGEFEQILRPNAGLLDGVGDSAQEEWQIRAGRPLGVAQAEMAAREVVNHTASLAGRCGKSGGDIQAR